MSAENAKRDWSEAKRRSQHRVNLRVTDDEFAELEKRAETASASLSGYVKAAALGAPIPRRTSRPVNIDRAAVLKLLAELGKLGSNANQTARANNLLARSVMSGDPADSGEVKNAITEGRRSLEKINAELVELRGAIYDALNLK